MSLKNIEIDLEKTEQEERLLLFKFAKILGLDPEIIKNIPAGYINPEYSGFIEETQVKYWIKQARGKRLDLIKKRFQISVHQKALDRAKYSWLPEITGDFSFSFSGAEYPLSEPGFNLGINVSFQLPVMPIEAGTSLGKRSLLERSLGFTMSGTIPENLEELYSIKIAKINLSKAGSELEDFETDLHFNIQESIFTIVNQKKCFHFLKKSL